MFWHGLTRFHLMAATKPVERTVLRAPAHGKSMSRPTKTGDHLSFLKIQQRFFGFTVQLGLESLTSVRLLSSRWSVRRVFVLTTISAHRYR